MAPIFRIFTVLRFEHGVDDGGVAAAVMVVHIIADNCPAGPVGEIGIAQFAERLPDSESRA